MAHAKVSVEDDAIDAIVTAEGKILVKLTQSICHRAPFAVSNPSARLLKRMAMRLGERVGYLIGESEESDSMWIESNASWRTWIEHTPGIEAAAALGIRDQWRHEYNMARREHLTATSHRESVKRMSETDWDKRYQLMHKQKKSAASVKQAGGNLFA
jgi:hypothetical protein